MCPGLILFLLPVILAASSDNQLCRVAAGGRLLRPGQEYRLVLFLCGEGEVDFRATILYGGSSVVAEAKLCLSPGYYSVPIKVPNEISHGNYSIVLEGKEVSSYRMFKETFLMDFTPKFLSLVIQTSRPIYTSSQTVRFRVLALDTNLRPFDDALEVYVIDPDDFIMRRWLSVFTSSGIASFKYKLPELSKEGYWKIRIKAKDQVEELKIKVENYFPPLFEVFVELPPYVLDFDEYLLPKIYSRFTSEEIVRGNCTIKAYVQTKDSPEEFLFFEEKLFLKSNEAQTSIPLNLIGKHAETEIKVEAAVKEFLSGETVTGFARTKIINSSVKIRFLHEQPAFFRPSMPFHSYVAIQYSDNVAVKAEILEGSSVSFSITFHLNSGEVTIPFTFSPTVNIVELYEGSEAFESFLIDPLSEMDYIESGVLGFNVMPVEGTEKISLTVQYNDMAGNNALSKLVVLKLQNSNDKYLSLWTSTEKAVVDEYSIFHLKTNFWAPSFQYLIISKGSVVNSGEVAVTGYSTSFPVALSPDMAPGFRIVVFTLVSNQLVSDSIFQPLSAFNRYEMELTLNTGKDFRGDMVELIISGDEAAYICAHSVRSNAYHIQAGNEITESRVIESFFALENFSRPLNKVRMRDREGSFATKSVYYQSPDYGKDPNTSFSLSGLFLSSSAVVTNNAGPCAEWSGDWIPCFDGSCFLAENRCDGIPNCADLSDETNCDNIYEDDFDYKIHRISRSTYLYDKEFGDWGWREIKRNDHEGIEFEPLDAPFLDDEWYFTAFSVSPKLGFSILPEPVIYSTKRPFSAFVSGPPSCKHGEQVGLKIILKNNDPSQALILLQLVSSPDYKFVHVEEDGAVSSYSARTSSGQHQLLVYIPPESQRHIDYPIVPAIEQGDIEIKLVASTMTGRAVLVHKITVLPEGAIVKRHTSVMLDLKNRAYVLNYLNIIVEETPIVPYQEWRRYIYGSPKGSVIVTGDVIGPVFHQMPMKQEDILERFGKGSDSRVMEFFINILNLYYLRFTNKITPAFLRESLEEANTIYAHIMKRYDPGGWLSNWDGSQPSVWLTAWALRALKFAMYADWENTLYIDSLIFQRSAKWLLAQQSAIGSFVEDNNFYSSLDLKMRDNRTLTAHVVLGLVPCLGILEGDLKIRAVRGVMKAVQYLEKSLPSDPHSLAIVALALHTTQSNSRDESYFRLMNLVTESGDQVYWSKEKLPSPPIKIQNQRPFLQPRTYIDGITETVETTSIALLVLLIREGVTPLADKIVLTLNSLRMSNCGFISMTDTTFALEALTEYANRARVLELTNIDVRINSGVDPDFKHVIHVTTSSILDQEKILLNKVWGHVNVIGKGAGLALVQMDVSYGIDWEPLKDTSSKQSFELSVREIYNHERNKSAITIQACMRWLRDWPSGRAVLEMEVPTGYRLVESAAISYINDVPLLCDAKTLPGLTMWFFDHIPSKMLCFNHTVRRWHPVANISLTRQALLYEINARENFVQTLVNSTSLYILNICEVCGSYQCPYCPFYNTSTMPSPSFILISILAVLFSLQFVRVS